MVHDQDCSGEDASIPTEQKGFRHGGRHDLHQKDWNSQGQKGRKEAQENSSLVILLNAFLCIYESVLL